MPFIVIKRFREIKHKDRVYEIGQEYPAKGYKSTKARTDELSSTDNKYKIIFIEEVKTPKEKE
ncbi:hypothetical protein [Psychrobacillus phage Spoks]|nr:hypothetical protein [Psychrobacillus phage Spoks]